MLNGGASNLRWSRSPIFLYDQSSLSSQDGAHSRLCSDQAANFAGTFSIRSILSHSRPQAQMGAVQDPRYMPRIPSSRYYDQPQVVCCGEETISPIHLQATVSASNQGVSVNRPCDMATFESTKVSGCLGVQSSIAKARGPRRANKRSRTIFTPFQLQRLEKAFDHQQYVAGEERRQLATGLNLTETQVKVWFQNRRIRFRKQRVKGPIS